MKPALAQQQGFTLLSMQLGTAAFLLQAQKGRRGGNLADSLADWGTDCALPLLKGVGLALGWRFLTTPLLHKGQHYPSISSRTVPM